MCRDIFRVEARAPGLRDDPRFPDLLRRIGFPSSKT
jgi:hypothetical protein